MNQQEQSLSQAMQQIHDFEAVVNYSRSVVMRRRTTENFPIEYVTQNVSHFGLDAAQLVSGEAAWTDRLHHADLAEYQDLVQCYLEANLDEYTLEYRVLDRDHRVRWVTDRSHALRSAGGQIVGYVNVIADITERMQREHELGLLASTAAALNKATTLAAAQPVVLHAVCEALGTDTSSIAMADLEADSLLITCGCGEWELAVGHTQPLDTGASGHVLATLRPFISDDVRHSPLVVNPELARNTQAAACVPLLVGDQPIGVLAAGRSTSLSTTDVRLLVTIADMAASTLHRINVLETLEQRVALRTQELLDANRSLEELSRHKDEFLATMSHELRTPLTAVLGMSEALDSGVYGEVNQRQQRAVQVILQSGRHLLHQINEVLDLSRIESGRVHLTLDPCSVDMVCQSCLTMVAEMAHNKRQKVIFEAPQQITMLADTRRLHQLLLNLLGNASKFTPEGGSITLRVHGDRAAATVVFEVVDSGIGIAPEDQERIFEPFVQLDSTLSRQYTGSGLGLALVRRIAALHDGSVEVISSLGQGSRFVVTLPWR